MSENLRQQLSLLPDYLANHLYLSVLALGVGIALSVPLGIIATRHRRLEWPLLAAANILQTIPSLALLALMVPLLGQIGFLPALLALILYSMLPILRNTVTGVRGIDSAILEAASAMGMTDLQKLVRIELPLAAPVLIAGIRIAAIWVVGIATLSTPVGAPSLGNYIFSGLQTQNYTAVLVGVVSAASLALILDFGIWIAERAATRHQGKQVVAALLCLAILLAVPAVWPRADVADSYRTVRLGTKTFTEQYILAALIEQRLEAAGTPSNRLDSLGSTVVFDALRNSLIDLYVDYSGTIWANHMGRNDNPGRQEVLSQMKEWLGEKYGILSLGSLGFENKYALAMRRDRAEELGMSTLSDLATVSHGLTIGGDYEFFSRPEWETVRRAYHLNFRNSVSFDSSLMYRAVAEGEVDVISAFSTDGRISAYDLRVLEDPKQALPPYDAVLLIAPRSSHREELVRQLSPLIGEIDDEEMRRANRLVDLEGKTIPAAAQWLSSQIGE